MNRHRFIAFDRLSRNRLGAEPTAAEHLETWDDDEEITLRVDPAKLSAVTAA